MFQALLKYSTDAMKRSRVLDYANWYWTSSVSSQCTPLCQNHAKVTFLYLLQVSCLQYRKLDFEEFSAAAISFHQMEGLGNWEQHARRAYELFEGRGNRAIIIEELASVPFCDLMIFFYLASWLSFLLYSKILLWKTRIFRQMLGW